MTAVFDTNDHTIVAGWATYHMDTPSHPHIEAAAPEPPDGHSPSNFARCGCGVWLKWFVLGLHRSGSMTACLLCRAVWAALEADPRIRAALDQGLADLAAGRRIPWDETLEHDDQPHDPAAWTPGCPRCDEERMSELGQDFWPG